MAIKKTIKKVVKKKEVKAVNAVKKIKKKQGKSKVVVHKEETEDQLKLFNTLTRKKEVFKSIKPGYVGMYTCGLTVYNYAHIGNLRTYVFEDILKRVLKYNGFNTQHIMNITDVGHLTSDEDAGEDKIELGAEREHKSPQEIASYYTAAFKNDLKYLNIVPPDLWCKATEHISDQISLIKKLEEKGYTYIGKNGNVYFNTAKFKKYGKLAMLDLKNESRGRARVEKDSEKKNPRDFVLWFSLQGSKFKGHLLRWDFVDEMIVSDEEYNHLKEIAEKNSSVEILEVEDV
ncbi:MAG: class I tRNA ligase family protein [Candidatus Pacearchaeota archaeon]|nr:class I tRNA ligase family protein [Candidatus Pacearchaeota archaeon]